MSRFIDLRRNMPTCIMALLASLATGAVTPHAVAANVSSVGSDSNDSKISDAVKRFGMRAVQPLSPAENMTLRTLAGGTGQLSDTTGDWALLTFFATWCGPCATEMPSLESLHRQFNGKGLKIVGISTDNDPALVKKYVTQKGLSFSIMVDTDGRASRTYRANSIPVSYLITPDGRIAGVARGARDWTKAVGLFNRLIEITGTAGPDAPTAVADAAWQQSEERVELPSTLVPPTAKVSLATASQPHPDDAFNLQVRIQWAGSFKDYLLLPPEVELPEGVEHLGTSATTSSSAGRAVIDYTIAMRAKKIGEYALDPVLLRYTPHGESEPVSQRIAGPTVVVVPVTIAGVTPFAFAGSATGVLALLCLGTLVLVRRRRPRPPSAAEASQARQAYFSERLLQCRKARSDGDIASFLESITELLTDLGDKTPPDTLGAIDAARYGGAAPRPEELDSLERRAQRLLAARANAPEAAEIASLGITEGQQT